MSACHYSARPCGRPPGQLVGHVPKDNALEKGVGLCESGQGGVWVVPGELLFEGTGM